MLLERCDGTGGRAPPQCAIRIGQIGLAAHGGGSWGGAGSGAWRIERKSHVYQWYNKLLMVCTVAVTMVSMCAYYRGHQKDDSVFLACVLIREVACRVDKSATRLNKRQIVGLLGSWRDGSRLGFR